MTFFSRFFIQKKEETRKPQNWKQSLFSDFKDILYILVIFLVIYAFGATARKPLSSPSGLSRNTYPCFLLRVL